MFKFDIVTIGSAVKDVTFYTDQGRVILTPQNLTSQKMLAFEYGAKISAVDSFQGFGGGAANSAITFARLKYKTAIVACVGQDETGREIINNFKKEKINTNFIQQNPKKSTALSFIIATAKKEKEHIVFTDRGADEHLFYDPKITSKINTKWFYMTSLCGKACSKNLNEIFSFAKTKRIKIAWNPGGVQIQSGKRSLAPFLKQTNVLILNKDEAIELVLSGIKLGRKNPNHLNRPIYLLNILHEWGPKIILITDGKKGAYAYDGKKIYKAKILNTKVVDTTGVGDSFGSAFIAGLIDTRGQIQPSLRWGMINSGSVVAKVGAQNGIVTLKKLKDKF